MTPAIRFSEADLPTAHGMFRIAVYRFGDEEGVALWCGEVAGKTDVLARVHSECLTGEVFGSLRCDCRSQLELALGRIGEQGAGVLVYLRQEGRGIGLANKVKAYALQDAGRDTVDANIELGFAPDLRSYEMAAAILRDLGVQSVRLMTNNPAKVDGLDQAGLVVASHESHWAEDNEASRSYRETKMSKMGHMGASRPGKAGG
jgi:GTP cyclohydrolase II